MGLSFAEAPETDPQNTAHLYSDHSNPLIGIQLIETRISDLTLI